MIPSLTEDCGRCAALCCLALAFDKGDSFAIDKPAGTACPNLSGHACSIHDGLVDQGFSGCVRYSCSGAGQRVVQELFEGRSWQVDPTLVGPMMEAFRGMRAVQERLALLSAASNLELDGRDRAFLDQSVLALQEGTLTLEDVCNFPGSSQEKQIDQFVRTLGRYIRR